MDNNSLKDSGGKKREYDPSLRFKYLEAVEWATQQMITQLRDYVAFYEIGPEVITVRSEWYQSSPCVQGLMTEAKQLGLTSKLAVSDNGCVGDLNFNLDNLADEYLSTIPEEPFR